MDRNFERAMKHVRKYEGGWSDHPKDPGGATMKGVTLENYRRYINPKGTKSDLRKITDAQVASVFRRFYWDAVNADDLPSGVDFATFDYAVNSGPGRAAKHLQDVLDVKQDGIIGPNTLAAVRARSAASVVNELCDRRMKFLMALNTWDTFGKGWTARVSSVRAEGLKMAAEDAGKPRESVPPIPAPNYPPKGDRVPEPTVGRGGGIVAALLLLLGAIAAWFSGIWESFWGMFQ